MDLLLTNPDNVSIVLLQIPELNQCCHDGIGISFPELKQHYHMPSHSLAARHWDA